MPNTRNWPISWISVKTAAGVPDSSVSYATCKGYIVFIFPSYVSNLVSNTSFVRPSHSWKLRQSFTLKFLMKDIIISATTHEKAFIFGPWEPWRVCFHSISYGPRVHATGLSWRSKSMTLQRSVILLFFKLTPSKDIRSDTSHPFDLDFHVMRWRSEWPIFHGWVTLLNSLNTIW